MSPTYVIGHVNPDMDSIASAIGYAWFLKESEGGEIIPARAGAINPQTTWVLNRLGIDPPSLITDASPRFEAVARRLDTTEPDSPLREAWAILTRTGGIVPIVDPLDGSPFGLITGYSLFKYLECLNQVKKCHKMSSWNKFITYSVHGENMFGMCHIFFYFLS